MSKVEVTQVRSIIDRPRDQKETIKSLGLGRINKKRIHTLTPQIEGMIKKVSHLVAVKEIES
jgi:large subunit ribosomal protein L30